MIRRFRQRSVFLRNKGIIIFRSTCSGSGKSISDFKAFYSADGHNGFSQRSIQLIKNRFSYACRKSVYNTLDHTAAGVFPLYHIFQITLCLCCRFFIRHIQAVIGNFFQIHLRMVDLYRSHCTGVCLNRNSKAFKELCCYSTCCHSSNGLSSGRTSAAPVITKAILFIKGIICMARTVYIHDIAVITGALVCVADHNRDWCSCCFSLKNTG